MSKPTTVTCTRCATSALIPDDRNHAGLWDEGWRWIGSQGLFSCPACPPVVVIEQEGRHLRGPGAVRARKEG